MKNKPTRRAGILGTALILFSMLLVCMMLVHYGVLNRIEKNQELTVEEKEWIKSEVTRVNHETICIFFLSGVCIFISGMVFQKKERKRDKLTGLYAKEEVESDIVYLTRHKKEFTVCVMDVDDFKKINTKYGHPGGDQYLKAFGQELNKLPEENVHSYRWGGDEFLCIIISSDTYIVRSIIQEIKRIRNKKVVLDSIHFYGKKEEVYFSFCMGTESVNAINKDATAKEIMQRLVIRADRQCMQSKKIKDKKIAV